MNPTPSYFQVCAHLIKADLACFKQNVIDKLIDLTIWVTIVMINTEYIMPYFGLASTFGPIQLGGVLAAVGLFELYSSTIELVSDYEGDRLINYHLTLPIPSYMAIISKAIYYWIVYITLTLCMLPISAIAIWSQLDWTHISLLKLFLAIITQCIFYACFVLWTSSIITNMNVLGQVWSRFIFPMWFMGGFNFSWNALHKTLPIFSYINLLNPMIYITESTRIALLGQADYLNFWVCISVITTFATIFGTLGIYTLKKRLDFI